MLQKIYGIKDGKAEYFLKPFYSFSEEEAVRSIKGAVLDTTHPFSKSPMDFDLYYLGQFDDNTGIFQMEDSPKHMFKLDQLMPKETPIKE